MKMYVKNHYPRKMFAYKTSNDIYFAATAYARQLIIQLSFWGLIYKEDLQNRSQNAIVYDVISHAI